MNIKKLEYYTPIVWLLVFGVLGNTFALEACDGSLRNIVAYMSSVCFVLAGVFLMRDKS